MAAAKHKHKHQAVDIMEQEQVTAQEVKGTEDIKEDSQ